MSSLTPDHIAALNRSRLRIITGDEDYSPKWYGLVSDYFYNYGVEVDEVIKEPLDSVEPKAGDIMIVVRALKGTPCGEGGVKAEEVAALRDKDIRVPLIFVTGSIGYLDQHVKPILRFTDNNGYADYMDSGFGSNEESWLDAFTSAVIGVVKYWENNAWK